MIGCDDRADSDDIVKAITQALSRVRSVMKNLAGTRPSNGGVTSRITPASVGKLQSQLCDHKASGVASSGASTRRHGVTIFRADNSILRCIRSDVA